MRRGWSVLHPFLWLLLGVCPAERATAQIPGDYPVVGISLPSDCDQAVSICETGFSFDNPGQYDVWISPILESEGADSVQFGVVWPDTWRLLETELCYGTIREGDIASGSGVTLWLPPNMNTYLPALRIRFDATTAGRFALTYHPVTGRFARYLERFGWMPMFGVNEDMFYVSIGDPPPCTQITPPLQCSYCDFVTGGFDAGSLHLPPIVTMPKATVLVDTLDAYSELCSTLPECGEMYPGGGCLGGASSDAPWLTFRRLDTNEVGAFRMEMTVDARELTPGTYEACITAGWYCRMCAPVFYSMTLQVGPLPVESATWGQVKAQYLENRK